MSVVVLTSSIAPYLLSLFRHLRDRVTDLQILVSTRVEPDRDWEEHLDDLPVRIQKSWIYPAHRHYGDGFKEDSWRHVPYDVLPILFREKPRVVISTELGLRTMQAVVYRKVFPNSRLIIWNGFSEHTEKGIPYPRTLQRKLVYRAADAASANGASAVNYLKRLGVPEEKIFQMPYCADVSHHLELPLKRDREAGRRLLYVGQLIERKGLLPFLKVLSDWLQKHPEEKRELWIAGDGPLRRKLEEFPASSQLRLSVLGNIAYEKLPELYGQAGILVFPTLADEWGVVVNEALAGGVPVLGSAYSQAVVELVREGETGWTFNPDVPSEVQHAIERALTTSAPGMDGIRRLCRQAVRHLTPSQGANRLLRAVHFVQTGAWDGGVESGVMEASRGFPWSDSVPHTD